MAKVEPSATAHPPIRLLVRLLAENAAPFSFEMKTLLFVFRPCAPRVLLPLLLFTLHPETVKPERLEALRTRLPIVTFTVLPSLT